MSKRSSMVVPTTFGHAVVEVVGKPVRGLVITEQLNNPGLFEITHAASGMAVPGDGLTLYRARRLRAALVRLRSWDGPSDGKTMGPSMLKRVQAAIREWR